MSTTQKRIESVREALAKFSAELTSERTFDNIREIIAENDPSDTTELIFTVRVRPYNKDINKAVASLEIHLASCVKKHYFPGLNGADGTESKVVVAMREAGL